MSLSCQCIYKGRVPLYDDDQSEEGYVVENVSDDEDVDRPRTSAVPIRASRGGPLSADMLREGIGKLKPPRARALEDMPTSSGRFPTAEALQQQASRLRSPTPRTGGRKMLPKNKKTKKTTKKRSKRNRKRTTKGKRVTRKTGRRSNSAK